jgi:phosphohistidine phosphatase
MLLHLLRHAHAGDPSAFPGPDNARPLTDKGRAQARRLGDWLAAQGFASDLVLSSPKVRARETADIVAERLGMPVVLDDGLAVGLDLAGLDALLAAHGDPVRPVLVGHDPDCSEWLAELCGASDIPMRKGAFARLEVDRPLRPGGATLRWLVPPDALKPER